MTEYGPPEPPQVYISFSSVELYQIVPAKGLAHSTYSIPVNTSDNYMRN